MHNMKKAYMIAECVGDSIYEQHTIAYVYMRKEWALYQIHILEQDAEQGITYRLREVFLVENGPE